ncbi:flagellar hook protein FlgE [Pseudobutyrivibrio xylanivorans]|uniref:Flagellar hook protein FlgE n=1 Tax=Pseudobutyrivibrio xylanivorans TaxID=185007 RepID=A0A5P6VVJ0_PSEXY|nr:flagellar hook-basal body complex protein [Pseudobutyrivibrio xylanivorans]QFJ55484.1 flagellar hook-basal body complex protein [Pseudobutyrivibrio xylanivorans]
MMRSLFSGVSGLKTHQTKMDVIGNNISNVNTVAFKSSSTTFSDIMYQTTSQASGATATRGGKNAKQIGLGVTNGATKVTITSAGAAQSTGDALDIRLTDSNSTNFFIVSNGSQNLFTRAGSFYIDGNGNLAMTTTGYLVMGWQIDPDNPTNIIKDTVTPLRVMKTENLTSSPEATTEANFNGVIDKNDSQFSSSGGYVRSFTLYDNLGYSYTAKFSFSLVDGTKGEYNVSLLSILDGDNNDLLKTYTPTGDDDRIFGKTLNDTSNYNLAKGYSFTNNDADASEITDGSKLYGFDAATQNFVSKDGSNTTIAASKVLGIPSNVTIVSVAQGTSTSVATVGTQTIGYRLKFDTQEGYLDYVDSAGNTSVRMLTHFLGPNTEDPLLANAALSDINIDFSKLLNYDNGGTSTAVGNRGATDGTTGTGKKLGTMTGLSIQTDGKIFGSYSNGNSVLLGQIAVAQFANASGLEEKGDNCYDTTLNSGEFDGIGIDISADGSSMNTGQLEMANVDLSSEFTDMITTQRGFQANSRIITVSDTMLEELINLKR